MSRTVYIEKSEGRVVGVYCIDCHAEGPDPEGREEALLPGIERGIVGFAVALLCCDECGDNLADQIASRDGAKQRLLEAAS